MRKMYSNIQCELLNNVSNNVIYKNEFYIKC